MYISKINNDINFKSGLFFTKSSSVLFNQSKELNYLSEEVVKKSPTGVRYIENTKLSREIKDAFFKIPLIKNLAEKFDTFIWFSQISKDYKEDPFLATAKIMWADYSKSQAESRMAYGASIVSEKDSFEKMIKNIEKEIFI